VTRVRHPGKDPPSREPTLSRRPQWTGVAGMVYIYIIAGPSPPLLFGGRSVSAGPCNTTTSRVDLWKLDDHRLTKLAPSKPMAHPTDRRRMTSAATQDLPRDLEIEIEIDIPPRLQDRDRERYIFIRVREGHTVTGSGRKRASTGSLSHPWTGSPTYQLTEY
jgi:hypothetical protein